MKTQRKELIERKENAIEKAHNYLEMLRQPEIDYPNYDDLKEKIEIQLSGIYWANNEMKK